MAKSQRYDDTCGIKSTTGHQSKCDVACVGMHSLNMTIKRLMKLLRP